MRSVEPRKEDSLWSHGPRVPSKDSGDPEGGTIPAVTVISDTKKKQPNFDEEVECQCEKQYICNLEQKLERRARAGGLLVSKKRGLREPGENQEAPWPKATLHCPCNCGRSHFTEWHVGQGPGDWGRAELGFLLQDVWENHHCLPCVSGRVKHQ